MLKDMLDVKIPSETIREVLNDVKKQSGIILSYEENKKLINHDN